MKKFTIIDECACNKEEARREEYVENILGSWEDFWEELCAGSLDSLDFSFRDIDRDIFYILDGGEMLKLKDGRYMNVCWRGNACHVWEETDAEYLEYLNEF